MTSNAIYMRKLKHACRRDGICVNCHKAKAKPDHKICGSCMKHKREHNRIKKVRKKCPACFSEDVYFVGKKISISPDAPRVNRGNCRACGNEWTNEFTPRAVRR